ncbi:MAG: SEC-C metal-binding domain-containing protein [Candidatus Sumerlaeota bacterium]|nr:SEC-C metal-binding domain-containing protein [Candidatus Sumerlaeota bacterium]
MIGWVLKALFGDKNRREVRRLHTNVAKINAFYEQFESLSDEELAAKTPEFRRRLAAGETLNDLLPEAYAAVKQACKRKCGQTWSAAGIEIQWNMVPFDVQLMGGVVLHEGKIAEMATGEGKTLVAILPLYLNALEGRGCHLVTHNDFLARRDAEWNGPIFGMLGVRVGCIQTDMDPGLRREAYGADITYGTANEFGFDYLRENMATRPEYLVQNSACWQSAELINELQTWSGENGAQLVEALPYAVTLDVDPARLNSLLERFGGRFGVDSFHVKIADEDEEGLRASLDGRSSRIADVLKNARNVAPGRVHVRVDFVRHGHHYAIVDEVDSILIDEARTPLIISGAVDRATHRFDTIKPLVVELVHKQTALLTRFLNEAEAELKKDESSYEAGLRLFQCHLGGPKNRRFMKLRVEPRLQRMILKVENDHILFKKNVKSAAQAEADPLFRVEEELYFVIDEKGGTIDLMEKGRHALSPSDPDYFVLDDLVEATEKIESRHNPLLPKFLEDGGADSAASGELNAEERAALAARLEEEEKQTGVAYADFVEKLRHDGEFTPEELASLRGLVAQAGEVLKQQMHERHEVKAEELHNISQLLRAYMLFEKDVEYVVQDNKVIIVDEFTGRLQPGRRFTDGLHQALEAKENVQIERETQTLATVTLQNYFRMYKKLAGMTGTAETEAGEFAHTYKMDVVVIPTNRPVIRKDFDDVIYRTRREKFNAIIDEIERLHRMKLPILVGTVSVEVSETLSRMLRRKAISHNVLNAKYHQKEAEIVSYAGQPGQVTIATNMAGRGTDIKLGPGVTESRHCEIYKTDWPAGLQIVGTERHDARRIDRQLRGRSGRQGDPGASRFFLSLEDDLMRKFGSDRIAGIMQKLGMEEGEPIEHPFVTRAITKAQKRVEEWHFEIRKRTLEYDNVMNKQREAIYGLRRQVLEGLEIKSAVLNLSYDALAAELRKFANEKSPNDSASWDLEGFRLWVKRAIPFLEIDDIDPRHFDDSEDYVAALMPRVEKTYDFKNEIFGEQLHRDIARYLILRTIDENWRDHLLAIDELREGIHLRSYAQLNPLTEYQREATLMFEELMYGINKQVFSHLYKATLIQEAPGGPLNLSFQKQEFDPNQSPDQARQQAIAENRPERPKGVTYRREAPKVGRNEPCPCGSGKKYKHCCGAAGGRMGSAAPPSTKG